MRLLCEGDGGLSPKLALLPGPKADGRGANINTRTLGGNTHGTYGMAQGVRSGAGKEPTHKESNGRAGTLLATKGMLAMVG